MGKTLAQKFLDTRKYDFKVINKSDINYSKYDNYTGDCYIRSIMTATNQTTKEDWHKISDELLKISLKTGYMVNNVDTICRYLKNYRFSEYIKELQQPTLDSFANKHCHGTYVIFLNHHVIAMKDGVIYNNYEIDGNYKSKFTNKSVSNLEMWLTYNKVTGYCKHYISNDLDQHIIEYLDELKDYCSKKPYNFIMETLRPTKQIEQLHGAIDDPIRAIMRATNRIKKSDWTKIYKEIQTSANNNYTGINAIYNLELYLKSYNFGKFKPINDQITVDSFLKSHLKGTYIFYTDTGRILPLIDGTVYDNYKYIFPDSIKHPKSGKKELMFNRKCLYLDAFLKTGHVIGYFKLKRRK